ncbi:Protein of uncharacterised function DUF45 [Bacteroides xylanisolvens]|nr:Protein of uncharacterised function DUF45 [Bacteroides xylanisolvens]
MLVIRKPIRRIYLRVREGGSVEVTAPRRVSEREIRDFVAGKTAWLTKYRVMKSRWGSCRRVTGRFSFALDLVTKPKECIEAVVVHELCHLFVAGHGPDFYARMETYLPDYKERDRLLSSLPRELI